MRLTEAQSIIREVSGKPYSWLEQWGLSIIKEAIYTIRNRKSSTEADKQLVANVQWKITRGW